MVIEVTEILRQSEHGVTRPYLCRADDGELYYAKGFLAGRESLVFEWLAGCLGRAFGLPIPEFRILHVPDYLVSPDMGDYSDLGDGFVFGSRYVDALLELTRERVGKISLELQRDVLVFDWWVKNEDRKLGNIQGNPNLFLEPKDGHLVVLDHNCAFDKTFNPESFVSGHVFCQILRDTFGDLAFRAEYGNRFDDALSNWGEVCAEIPVDWLYWDGDVSGGQVVDLEKIYTDLCNHDSDGFWVTP